MSKTTRSVQPADAQAAGRTVKVKPGDVLPLVGNLEIARRAGVHRAAVNQWAKRYADWPQPVANLSRGPVYWWPHVEAWLANRDRRRAARS